MSEDHTKPGTTGLDPSDTSGDPDLLGLFLVEVEGVVPRLQETVLSIEANGPSARDGEAGLRLVHGIKGAARIVGLTSVVAVLHAAEDVLGAVQRGRALEDEDLTTLLKLVDLLADLTRVPAKSLASWLESRREALGALERHLRGASTTEAPAPAGVTVSRPAEAAPSIGGEGDALRISADAMSRLLGLAGETVVEARRFSALSRSTASISRTQTRVKARATEVHAHVRRIGDPYLLALVESLVSEVDTVGSMLDATQTSSSQGLSRLLDTGERLYLESLRARQRPFAQLVPTLRRHVRDAAAALKKRAKLELSGAATLVDGDVLAAIEPMLHHLVVNSIDHGLESEAVRVENGKPAQGTVRIELRHARGQLALSVGDDGGGIDPERIREVVIRRALTDAITARNLGRDELLEMLFLPGFSTRGDVSVHSGRGVGLNAVQEDCVKLGGRISIHTELGRFTRFDLTLPTTRVVVRALLVSVAGETYALPLAHAGRVVRVSAADVHNAEGRDYVELDGENVGVIRADEVLEIGPATRTGPDITLVLLGDEGARYGLVVDATLGEDDLVVRPLDPRLGRIPDVAAAALLADGSPTLVLDVGDLLLSIEKLARRRGRTLSRAASRATPSGRAKHVLVVDDSITVREVQRQLLASHGYRVDVAVDGVEGWAMLRNGTYDLAVVDVDMPRMNGLELVRTIRADERLARLPVIIVSYKEGDDDRVRGLEVGADLYLSKSSFHDEQLATVVKQLIGDAT